MEGFYLTVGLMVVFGIVFFFLMDRQWKKRMAEAAGEKSPEAMWLLIQQQMDNLRVQLSDGLSKNGTLLTEQLRVINEQVHWQLQMVTQQLQSSGGQIGQRLDSAARVIGEVKENLGRLSKASEQIYEVGKNIATLQEILRPPKMRGGMGEQFLEELLAQILPKEFISFQYTFSSGERVDAVIRLGNRLVPIDSKFPLDNFRRIIESKTEEEKKGYQRLFLRDVKKHVDDIAGKYILPQEGTYDFALLYIPAENVYYEAITRDESLGEEKNLLSYALKKHVVPVSPSSLYAYLQVILLGLRGLKIEEHAQEIQHLLFGLRKEMQAFEEDFRIVGKHLTDAKNRYDEARGHLERFSVRLEQVEDRPSEPFKEP